MNIDWSKAPEGTTHAAIGGECIVWYRAVKVGSFEFCNDNTDRIWIKQNGRPMFDLIEQPVSPVWDGEGLPPVGTVCEVAPHNSQWGFDTIEPRRCTILGYHTEFVWLDTGLPGTPISTRTDKVDFNVIRTPEQIEAEERKAGILQMIDVFGKDTAIWGLDSVRDICAWLYDAGYRKHDQ